MKTKMSNRIISVLVSIALLLSIIPLSMLTAIAATTQPAMIADPSTIDQWKLYFPIDGNITTQNAGGVWSDKSVFTDATTIDGYDFSISNANSFLVALSAIGSNMTVTGMSQVPTDVMFVLDVSGSMADENNNAAAGLVSATNASIKSLLDANPYSRVGVVLYSGPGNFGNGSLANATVVLPLASYRTEDTQGRYLNYTNSNSNSPSYSTETVSVNTQVYTEVADSRYPNGVRKVYVDRSSKNVSGGTYIQAGLALAEEEFLEAETTVTAEGMGTVKRMPAIVLMSDGAVSLATDNFYAPGTSNLGDGGEDATTYDMGFVTQLTAAHTKYEVSQYYGTDCLFYTLGMINPNRIFTSTEMDDEEEAAHRILLKNVAHGVLDPANTAKLAKPDLDVDNAQLVARWNEYAQVAAEGYYRLEDHSNWNTTKQVLRVSDAELEKMSMNYVTRFFDANDYVSGTNGTLGDALAGAFKDIVAEIALQSVYHPTLVENGSADLSGYISFVDKIGQYMQVSDIKGIMTGGTLFTGEKLAKAFYDAFSGNGGDLGSAMGNGSALGVAFMDAMVARLGLDRQTAFALLQNAWRSGNISYTDESTYSNWFGWVSTSNGAYIQPWNETDNGFGTNYHIIPQNAAWVNRSYVFLGTEGNTDMMYATVRVREKVVNGVLTGEQEVDFAIPASLLPTVTYNVKLDETGAVENISVEPDTPIHLVYEVGLDPEINKFNVKDKVSAAYLADPNNTDENGNILFYTNAWERDGSTGYGKVNTYSYFRPSHQNDRYYYQSDSYVYSDTLGTEYDGATHPAETASGTYYYLYNYYAYNGTDYEIRSEYHEIPTDVLSVAVTETVEGGVRWVIKAGTVRSDYADSHATVIYKDDPTTDGQNDDGNKTGTLAFSHQPFADVNGYAYDDTSHSSVVGVTMANNGRLALTPDTGIRITKNLAADVALEEGENPLFVFDVAYAGQADDLEAFAYRFVNGELVGNMETVTFTAGKAEVKLYAGETLYIGGMNTGEVTVTERTTLDYVVQTVSVDGAAQVGDSATVTLATGDMRDIDFVNTERGTGILNVAKAVIFPTGVSEAAIIGIDFTVNVHLEWNGAPLEGFALKDAAGQTLRTTGTGQNAGNFDITLSHGEQFTAYNLPEGTVATIVENTASLPAGFVRTPVYWENGTRGLDGIVTVSATTAADVMIENTYDPAEVSTSFHIDLIKDFYTLVEQQKVAKTFAADESYTFTFTLQEQNAQGGWNTLDTATLTFDGTTDGYRQTSAAFADMLQQVTFSAAGIYRYRIVETLGSENHILYDQRTHSFGVEIADSDADGSWEIAQARTTAPDNIVTIAAAANGYEVDVLFENEYDITVGTEAVIEIQKTVNDPTGVVYTPDNRYLAEGFEFMVYQQDGITPAKGVSAQLTNSGGVTRFTLTYGTDVFDQFGSGTTSHAFHYVVKETDTGKAGWTYADDRYVTVVVSDGGEGTLQAIAYLNNATFSLQPGTYDTDNAVTVSFENTYAPEKATLDLNFINKQLDGREFTASDAFTFEIVGTNGSVIYGPDGVTALDPNAIQGTATANGGNTAKVTFADALYFGKVGTYYYKITETSAGGNGITADDTVYQITVTVTDNGAGALSAAYTVTSTADNEITFVNTYVADAATVIIEGTKTLTGRDLYENDFQFILEETATGNKWYTANATSGAASSGFAFEALTYTQAGSYTYTVREYDPTAALQNYYDGVIYDGTVFNVVVTVTDNGQGKLIASYTVNGSAATPIAFANTYAPDPIEVSISGIKEILGRGMLATDIFEFELFEVDYEPSTDTWTPHATALDKAQNIGNAITFEALSFDKAGVYRYTVSEVEGAAGGIDYDATTWRIAIVVTDDGNGVLSAETVYMTDSGRQNVMLFRNTYSVADGYTELSGHKDLQNKPIANEQFSFNLYQTDETFTIAEGADPKLTAKNDAVGDFTFTLPYTADDIGSTFYYVVLEQNAGTNIKGIAYSANRYHITVTVEDAGDGTLKITKTVMLGDEQADTLAFVNTYSVTDGELELNGHKDLKNKPIANEQFSFNLYQTDETFAVAEGADPKLTAKNDAVGDFTFTLPYTAADIGSTFYYVVLEQNAGATIEGIAYSANRYHITVTVEDSGDGTLKIEKTVMLGDESADTLAFVNVYTIADGKLIIDGKKLLEGRDLRNQEFVFDLYQTDNTYTVSGDPFQSASNGADGKFSFEVTYTKEDIGTPFYYVLKEADNGINGITYSPNQYHITVSVEDAGDGTLKIVPDMSLNGAPVEANAIQFINKYASTTSTVVEITKVIDNKGSVTIGPDGFEFLLEKVGANEPIYVTSDADGKATITLPYTEADLGETYTYKLREVAGNEPYMTYDATVYTFTVTLSLDAQDDLQATVTFGEGTVEKVQATFVNTYDVPDTPTGVEANLTVWVALAFVSGGAIVGLTVYGKKKKQEQV